MAESMTGSTVFGEPDDGVLEVVLSSEAEFSGGRFGGDADETRVNWALRLRALATRFLPGVEGGALFALGLAVVGMTTSSMIESYVTNRQLSFEMSTSMSSRTA